MEIWRARVAVLRAAAVLLLLAAPASAEVVYANKCAAGFYMDYSSAPSGDSSSTTSQKTVNCFAWKQFIALNWPADGRSLGEPGDRSPVQWQKFASEGDVFRADGFSPARGQREPLPQACEARLAQAGWTRENVTIFEAPPPPGVKRKGVNSTMQAGAADNQPAWVGDSNGSNLWYEIRISPEEEDFILKNHLYSVKEQAKYVAAGHPLVLPSGSEDGPQGSIELKAAWMEIPDPANAKWAYFKTADAAILDAERKDCRLTPVALVGLHIIQKTARQPSFFWATFEHIDNVPDESGAVSGSYNLHDEACKPREVEVSDARCLASPAPTPAKIVVGCAPNTRPPYHIGGACPAPVAIQTTRVVPIEPDTDDVNRMVQESIAKKFPGTVWQYYKLINVQWALARAVAPEAPLVGQARLPTTLPLIPVSNTTMETYLQTTTCTTCHVNAALADPPTHSADFSFVFEAAKH